MQALWARKRIPFNPREWKTKARDPYSCMSTPSFLNSIRATRPMLGIPVMKPVSFAEAGFFSRFETHGERRRRRLRH
jgi:hypothetical protein